MINTTGLPPNSFGVELEFATDTDPETVRSELNSITSEIVGSSWENYSTWQVKTDGSCGLEVTSPPMTWDNLRDLPKIADYLNSNYSVDESCGLHVHHHFDQLDSTQLRRMLLGWAVFEPVLHCLVDPSRAENSYCMPFVNSNHDYCFNDPEDGGDVYEDGAFANLDDMIKAVSPRTKVQRMVQNLGRYRGLNLNSWWRRSTIEVRLHHGSLDIDEIVTWIALTQMLLHSLKDDFKLKEFQEMAQLKFADRFMMMHTIITKHFDSTQFAWVFTSIRSRFRTHYPTTYKRVMTNG